MALPDFLRVQSGTSKTWKSSGGDALLTMTSVANAASRQGAKLDLGATRAEYYDVFLDMELAATPTAGNTIDVYWAPSSSATAGTDNPANVSGADAAYTGYSANADASLPQLQYVGAMVCTAQATATVQKAYVGRFSPAQRYGSPVLRNGSGAAVHSSATNIQLRFVPVEGAIEET
jgi:hypothetical protein